MNRLLLVALIAALALPAAAQSHLSDSSGVYLGLGGSYGGSSLGVGYSLAAGYRQAHGLDYGFTTSAIQSPEASARSSSDVSIGATLGYTLGVGRGAELRLESAVGHRYLTIASGGDDTAFGGRALGLDVSATLSTPVRLGGSFTLRPTAGLYANASRALSEAGTGRATALSLDGSDVGLQAGLPLSFRLLGSDVTLPLTVRYSFENGLNRAYGTGLSPASSLRLNF